MMKFLVVPMFSLLSILLLGCKYKLITPESYLAKASYFTKKHVVDIGLYPQTFSRPRLFKKNYIVGYMWCPQSDLYVYKRNIGRTNGDALYYQANNDTISTRLLYHFNDSSIIKITTLKEFLTIVNKESTDYTILIIKYPPTPVYVRDYLRMDGKNRSDAYGCLIEHEGTYNSVTITPEKVDVISYPKNANYDSLLLKNVPYEDSVLFAPKFVKKK